MLTTDKEFSIDVINEINYYVYRLIDPRNGNTFYVGKGKGNRVFQHVKCALSEIDYFNDKINTIREINVAGLDVIHIIHRHGMEENVAFEVEAALLDAYPGITNEIGGYGSNDFGPMSVKEIIDKYAVETVEFKHKVLMITVNKSITNRSIYDATRLAWKLNKKKADKADFILAVSQGIIKDVFITNENGWLQATKENFQN